jgi:hypothetical protein
MDEHDRDALIRRYNRLADPASQNIPVKLDRCGEVWDNYAKVIDRIDWQLRKLVLNRRHLTSEFPLAGQFNPIASI